MTEYEPVCLLEEDESHEDKAILLLDIIQNYEYLYNLRNKEYRNRKKKEKAWQEIAKLLNMNVDHCQKLWKSLRDKYTREKRDLGRSGAAAPECGWPLFEKMRFYERFTKPRQTYTSTSKSTTLKRKPSKSTTSTSRRPSTSSLSSEKSIWGTMLSPENSAVLSPETLEEASNEVGSMGETSETAENQLESKAPHMANMHRAGETLNVQENPTSSKIKRKASQEELEILDIAKKLASSIGSMRQQSVQHDVNRHFSDYIYSTLRDMPAEKAKKIRKKFMEVLIQEDD